MATYRINTPDGATYDVTAPDDASQADVLAYAQAHHAAQAPAAPAQSSFGGGDKVSDQSLSDLITGHHATTYNPTGISALDPVTKQLGGFGDALQHHLMNAPIGLGQLASHSLNAAIQGVAGGSQYAQGVQQRMAASDAQIQQREQAYQARTDGNAGSWPGAAVGEIAPWMTGMGEARAAGLLPQLPKTADIASYGGKALNILKQTGLLSAEGGAMGATAPVTNGGSYADQKERQIGTGLLAAPTLAGAGLFGKGVFKGGAWLLSHATEAGQERLAAAKFAKMTGNDPGAADALHNATQYSPGVQPSMAQVLPDPSVLQGERMLRANPASAPGFISQDVANDAARRQTVEGVTGTDADMTAARQARTDATQPFRDANLPEEGSKLIDPAGVVSVLQRLTGAGSKPVRAAAKEHLSLLQEHMDQNGGQVPAYAMDDIRQGVGDTLNGMAKQQGRGATPKEVVRYGPVKTALTDAIDGAIPGYSDHLAAYASHSAPINDMLAARSILDPNFSGGWNAGGDQVARVSRINQALRADDKANFPMTPEARQTLEGVRDSQYQRSISDQKVGPSGSNTDADSRLGSTLGRRAVNLVGSGVGLLGASLTGMPVVGDLAGAGLGGLLGEAFNSGNASVMRRVGGMAANASKGADALDALQLQQQRRRQGLLGRAANIPQYLLPYAH